MNTENKLKIDDFTKALAECINQAQCAVVDPMAHAEIWKKELLELAKGKEPVSEDLEKELSRLLKDCEIDSEYIHQDFLHIVANHFADWQKERIMANSTNATIGLPYENRYGGYTQLVDVSRPLPVGNNIIAIIFKADCNENDKV